VEKQRFNTAKATVEVLVDENPTFASIDPYNKLIDRNPEDNLVEVGGKWGREKKSESRGRGAVVGDSVAAEQVGDFGVVAFEGPT
jgi:hypothetical protein